MKTIGRLNIAKAMLLVGVIGISIALAVQSPIMLSVALVVIIIALSLLFTA